MASGFVVIEFGPKASLRKPWRTVFDARCHYTLHVDVLAPPYLTVSSNSQTTDDDHEENAD